MSNSNTISQTVSRTQAAAIIGVKPDTMKHWAMQSRGPMPAAKLGTQRQSRVLYELEEIERWRADPKRYERRAYGRHQQRGRW